MAPEEADGTVVTEVEQMIRDCPTWLVPPVGTHWPVLFDQAAPFTTVVPGCFPIFTVKRFSSIPAVTSMSSIRAAGKAGAVIGIAP